MSATEKLLYLVAGTGIGAVLGMLFAPQSGHETREMITDKVDEGRKFVREQGGAKGTVRNIFEGTRNRFNESVEAGVQEYQDRRDERVS